jgi:hypothetical protein
VPHAAVPYSCAGTKHAHPRLLTTGSSVSAVRQGWDMQQYKISYLDSRDMVALTRTFYGQDDSAAFEVAKKLTATHTIELSRDDHMLVRYERQTRKAWPRRVKRERSAALSA